MARYLAFLAFDTACHNRRFGDYSLAIYIKPMKSLFLALGITLFCTAPLRADDASLLAGKWSTKKTNEQGEAYTQTLEIKKDKFTFEILGTDGSVVLHAEGDLKLEKHGPFSAAHFNHIRAGQSSSSMDDVDDEYVSIYVLDGDTWTMASNFDKQRERQKPSADVYRKVKSAAAKSATSQ